MSPVVTAPAPYLKPPVVQTPVSSYPAAGSGTAAKPQTKPQSSAQSKSDSSELDKERQIIKEILKVANLVNNMYFGAKVTSSGEFLIETGPMTFSQAKNYVQSNSQTRGKRAKWGLYTVQQVNAYAVAYYFGGFMVPILEKHGDTQFPHYHVYGRVLYDRSEHFHVWFGTPLSNI